MTKEEEAEVIRVCGPDYDYEDIPAYIRERNENKGRVGFATEESDEISERDAEEESMLSIQEAQYWEQQEGKDKK